MALFDSLKKKSGRKETHNPQKAAGLPTDEYLDDMTFIRDIKHITIINCCRIITQLLMIQRLRDFCY